MYNILITAIGKRVQLISHLKKSFRVVGVDAISDNPASNFVDKFYKVPKCYESDYICSLTNICIDENVKLIIPLYEKEFDILSQNINMFESYGIKLLLSDKAVIDICDNKYTTYKFFSEAGILTPDTFSKQEILLKDNLDFPLIIKPQVGMGSENVYKATTQKELDFFKDYIKYPIIQKFKYGTEYTVDVLCDFYGDIISIVPRQRLEVRSGEVSKSRTVKDYNIIYKTKDVIENLGTKGKVIGPITVQCILDNENIYFIEINPRFGGGVPLTFEAGVNYGVYLSIMLENKKIDCKIGEFKELTMLRYDEAVFF